MTIAEITKNLGAAKKEYKSFLRSAGDDMGCDGSSQHAAALRAQVENLEMDLRDARDDRELARAMR